MKTNDSSNQNEKGKSLEVTKDPAQPPEMAEINQSTERMASQKKPVPKWEGGSSKIKNEGRIEVKNSALPFFVLFGSTILKRDFFFFGLIGIVIILMATIPTVIWMQDSRNARVEAYKAEISGETEREAATRSRPMANRINIHNLMQWHIATSNIDQLNSYQIKGVATMANDQAQTQIALLGLPPNQYRQDSWTDWDYRVSSRILFGKISHSVSSKAISLNMNKLEEAILWIESSLGYLGQTFLAEQKALTENNFDYSKLRFNKITDIENKRFAVVESETPQGFSLLHYIDYETGLESRRTAIIQSNGNEHKVEVLYFYKDISQKIEQNEPNLPFSYLLKVDGIPKYSVSLENAQINPGLTEVLFSRSTTNRYGHQPIVQ